jgi:transposase-like protein
MGGGGQSLGERGRSDAPYDSDVRTAYRLSFTRPRLAVTARPSKIDRVTRRCGISSRKSKERRRALCAGYTRSGLTVAASAFGVGVSPRTVYRWRGQFRLRRRRMGSGVRLRLSSVPTISTIETGSASTSPGLHRQITSRE